MRWVTDQLANDHPRGMVLPGTKGAATIRPALVLSVEI